MPRTKAVIGQDYTTLFGTSATDMKRQNHEYVVDVSLHNKVVVNYNILNADNVTLYLETAQVKDKMYWRTTQSGNAVGSGSITSCLSGRPGPTRYGSRRLCSGSSQSRRRK